MAIPAEAIIATTAGLKEPKIPWSIPMFRYFRYSFANRVTITQDGRIQPNVATIAPGIPAILIPTKVAEFTAMGPGVHLRDRDKICKFLHGKPLMKRHHLPLDQRHGRIPAAEAATLPILKKADKQLQIDHAFSLLPRIQVRNAPISPLAMTT